MSQPGRLDRDGVRRKRARGRYAELIAPVDNANANAMHRYTDT